MPKSSSFVRSFGSAWDLRVCRSNDCLSGPLRSAQTAADAHAGSVGSGSVDIAGSHHIWDSAAFWPVAGIIAAVTVGAWPRRVTRRAANPKRRLYYWLLSDTPLITERDDLSEELKVTYGPKELKSPRVVTVQLCSRGRRYIARNAFDDGKALCLDLGTHIVECVKVTTSPTDRPDPEWTTEDSTPLIGPSHFSSRQTTVFSLLVDGEPPSIVRPQQSLVDVRIERGDGQTTFRRNISLLVTATVAVVTAAIGVSVASIGSIGILVALTAVAGVTAAYFGFVLPRLDR